MGSLEWLRPVGYILLNVFSATSIVMANKAVLSTYGFHFTYALTLIHCAFTSIGMWAMARSNFFTVKKLEILKVMPLAAAFVGYVIFWNLALQLNTVGFYQLMKILITPAVIVLEYMWYKKVPSTKEFLAIGLLCLGVTLATVTDSATVTNMAGLAVGFAAVWATAVYQIWAGSKQRELQAGSLQLMHEYAPQATLLLVVLVPLLEPVGWTAGPEADTLLNYHYTPVATAAIFISAVLGLLVSLSTFLVIGATSSLTFNVVGHIKTVTVLSGGCILFGDAMPMKKLAGVTLAMTGIIWYSLMKVQQSQAASKESQKLPETVPLVNVTSSPKV